MAHFAELNSSNVVLRVVVISNDDVKKYENFKKRVTVDYEKYTDENGDLKEGNLDGMISRIFQHEYEHMLGRNFTEHASKMKLDMAEKKAKKQFKIWQKQMELRHGKMKND